MATQAFNEKNKENEQKAETKLKKCDIIWMNCWKQTRNWHNKDVSDFLKRKIQIRHAHQAQFATTGGLNANVTI